MLEASGRNEFESDYAALIADLKRLDDLKVIELRLLNEEAELKRRYGARYVGTKTNWNTILEALKWTVQLKAALGTKPIPERIVDCATGKGNLPDGTALQASFGKTSALSSALGEKFSPPGPSASGRTLVELGWSELYEGLRQLLYRLDDLQLWIDYLVIRTQLVENGLEGLIEALEHIKPARSQLLPAVQRAIHNAWIEAIFTEDKRLREFRGQRHTQLINEFRELDKKLQKLSVYRVIEKANERKPQSALVRARDSEAAILMREAAKQRRHMALRKLFERIPTLLTRLKPCLLMSPLSVSQFLAGPTVRFDLVIFDEASQICTQDAVCSIYRGKTLLVAGDNRQLPPTSFFQESLLDEYDWDDIPDDEFAVFESVLDECQTIGLPPLKLRWHYRSRHEALITFSNKVFYESGLVTFPSPHKSHESLGIQFIHVPDGVYDRGCKRNNLIEAKVVVDIVIDQLSKYPGKTVGVVTFNISQKETIQDAIELRVKEQPELGKLFSGTRTEDRLEGFFVKNLEDVQGDERDVMIFSIGYGYDQQHRVTANFGPLNKEGGERRLNVAVTRARDKVVIVSSIRAADIDTEATQAARVLHLRRYLDYAERGELALEQLGPQVGGEFESPLEESVAAEIRRLGYDVVPQFGCSGYRIDLVVVDPGLPGRFILGVECDGAMYHSAHCARDRDRLRQEVLERRGWIIHRIWSPDWVAKRETEVRRLKETIEEARKRINSGPQLEVHQESGKQMDASPGADLETREIEHAESVEKLPGTIPYRIASLRSSVLGKGLEFHLPEHRSEQCRLLARLVKEEGPIQMEYAMRRLVNAWGLERCGSRIRVAFKEIVRKCTERGDIVRKGRFVWPAEKHPVQVRVPVDRVTESWRNIQQVAIEEIREAMLLIIRHALGISVESLFVEAARLFRFNRTGEQIRRRLADAYQELRDEGIVTENGGAVTLAVDVELSKKQQPA